MNMKIGLVISALMLSACDFKQGFSAKSDVSQREYDQCIAIYTSKINSLVRANANLRFVFGEPDPSAKLLGDLRPMCDARHKKTDLTTYEEQAVREYFFNLDRY